MRKTSASAIADDPSVHTGENTILNYILFFFVCAFLGWIWEVTLTLLENGIFANRGVLHGPWLPIYGFGGLGIAFFLHHLRKHPSLVFLSAAIGCGLMEYATGWYLETFKGLKWWDYGDAWLSIHGRVCFMSILCFGLCGLAITYFIYPFALKIFDRLSFRPKKILCFALVLFFIGDFVYSSDVPNTGRGITDTIIHSIST